jgi:hypothetical protein
MSDRGFRYARSPAGINIAYTRFGAGPPLVVVPPIPFSNLSGDLAVPVLRPDGRLHILDARRRWPIPASSIALSPTRASTRSCSR